MVEILNENDNSPVFAENSTQSLIISEVWHFHKNVSENIGKKIQDSTPTEFSACLHVCVISSWRQ